MVKGQDMGMIFNIQRYSIHDGPGIRTTVFFKGCPLKCFWCQNPESQNRKPEIFLSRNKCTACGNCVPVCPVGANSILNNTLQIDRKKCAGCGQCVAACPTEARALIGKLVTADDVMKEVMRDARYYKNSGGGVTLSGGEVTAQDEFALLLLKSSKEAGLHTVLDTCGYTPWVVFEKLLKYTDLVLYDIKCMDSHKHQEGTGKTNDLILENAEKIARQTPMRIRVPIIHGWNDTAEEIKAIAGFVKNKLGNICIDLLPYNRMGEAKYERLDKQFSRLESVDDDQMKELQSFIEDK